MDVLIVIDMQEGTISSSDKYDARGVIERINQLSQQVRSNGGKVIFVQHDGTTEEGLFPHSDGWQILKALQQGEGDATVRKTTNDAFYNTQLSLMLAMMGATKLIFCGWATDLCVDTSIRAAISRDYRVCVAADCHTVSDREHLSAAQVIAHHNWVWSNMLSAVSTPQVLPMAHIY
ncbi:MAG: isochorismatase family protein [Pseudomonadales bacterium]|nr:isochorismatase family protein [Pseudomonadales bacterium]NRA17066.1 isochorismatase family protein [Oceanospirillaceae bacterium]